MSVIIKQRARFVYHPLSTQALTAIGDYSATVMKLRIERGVNATDHPARPLTKAYEALKVKRGGKPIRDWRLSGKTLASMAVLATGPNVVTVGFGDEKAALIAFWQTRKEKMFGVSPENHQAIRTAANQVAVQDGIVRVE